MPHTLHDCKDLICGCRRAPVTIFNFDVAPCPTCHRATKVQYVMECGGCGAVWLGGDQDWEVP